MNFVTTIPRDHRPIGCWLLTDAAAVFIMAVIGAVTRLTESGLSIVDWQPVRDILPPLSSQAWNSAFALYRQSPQYLDVNHGMSLADYQYIYFWEWLHRLWGRVVLGTVFIVPLAWFYIRGQITRALLPKLLLILMLGLLQGYVGWYMVSSGLVKRPSVSHYRLAMHLALALTIYAALVWNGLSLLYPQPHILNRIATSRIRHHTVLGLVMVCLTMIWGAFVAGLRAGQVYNTFPLMGSTILPADALFLHPLWVNFFENPVAVQFAHRGLALTTALVLLALGARAQRAAIGRPARCLAAFVALGVLCQIGLGVSTLLLHVPVALAAAHQAGAITVLTLVLLLLFALRPAPETQPAA